MILNLSIPGEGADANLNPRITTNSFRLRQSKVFPLQRCCHAESVAIRAGAGLASLAGVRVSAFVAADDWDAAVDVTPTGERLRDRALAHFDSTADDISGCGESVCDCHGIDRRRSAGTLHVAGGAASNPVSYTHLTLPTILRV